VLFVVLSCHFFFASSTVFNQKVIRPYPKQKIKKERGFVRLLSHGRFLANTIPTIAIAMIIAIVDAMMYISVGGKLVTG
jgi:hypothetical protein